MWLGLTGKNNKSWEIKQKAEEEKELFSAGMVWLFSYQVLQSMNPMKFIDESIFVKIDCYLLGFTTIMIEESFPN